MKKYLLIFCLISSPAFAEYHLLNIDHFDMRYEKFADGRDPYAPQYNNQWDYRVAADFDLSVGEILYWNNNTHFETLETQTPKTVGWQYELGLHLSNDIDLYREHHSRHIMEETSPTTSRNFINNNFPVEDVYGIRVQFLDDPTHKSSISNLIFGN